MHHLSSRSIHSLLVGGRCWCTAVGPVPTKQMALVSSVSGILSHIRSCMNLVTNFTPHFSDSFVFFVNACLPSILRNMYPNGSRPTCWTILHDGPRGQWHIHFHYIYGARRCMDSLHFYSCLYIPNLLKNFTPHHSIYRNKK